MSSADRIVAWGNSAKWLQAWPAQYGLAVVLVIAASLLRYGFGISFGSTGTYTSFYLPILCVALLVGIKAGLFASALSLVIADYFFVYRMHSLSVNHTSD